jgi:hypothetical protein
MSLTEEEEYAVYSNIPYLLYGGMTVPEAQKELEEYGLTGTIDPELSDELSAVIKKDDKVVHSVRGTQDLVDLLSDIRLGSRLSKLMTTIAAKPYLQPSLRGSPLDYIPDSERLMKIIKDVAPKGYKKGIPKTLNPEMRTMTPRTPIQAIKSLYALPVGVKLLSDSLNKLFEHVYPDSIDRFKQQEEKFEKIKEKYPKETFEFTGHSLGGGIANHLSRLHRSKAITYNSAPAHFNKEKAHLDSVVYRKDYDIVSFLREDEAEKVISSASKGYAPHSLTNFIPNKPVLRSEPVLRSKISEKLIVDRVRRCEEDPTRPECRRVFFV